MDAELTTLALSAGPAGVAVDLEQEAADAGKTLLYVTAGLVLLLLLIVYRAPLLAIVPLLVVAAAYLTATGLAVAASSSPEPVLLGSAMLGAVASSAFGSLADAMASMSRQGKVYQPSATLRAWHDSRFGLFCDLQQVGRRLTSAR